MKTLTKIALGALALIGVSCSNNHPEYYFDDKIGDEQVRFYEISTNNNYLEVKKADGTKIWYMDTQGDDLKLEEVRIEKDGKTKRYPKSSFGDEFLKEAQKQFDAYLDTIRQKAFDDLSK